MDNKNRKLIYKKLNPKNLRLYIFVNGLFVNNKNISLQIGYIIVLGNEKSSHNNNNKIRIIGNIIY